MCYRWNFDLRQYFKEVMGNGGATKEGPGHNTFLQIVIWGLPAIHTIVALITKLVDADELLGGNFNFNFISLIKFSFLIILGMCFVGNQSDKALLSLVAIPLLIYWTIGNNLQNLINRSSKKINFSS